MDTGSEDGEPGGVVDPAPLTDEERAMLDRLRDGGGEDVVGAAGTEAGDYPPPPVTHTPDPLDPVFREPTP